MRLSRVLAVVGLLSGCVTPEDMNPGGVGGGGGDLPDGFIQTGCMTQSDCDDGDPCTVDKCEPGTRVCKSTPKNCSGAATNECEVGECDPQSGACKAKPANESQPCTTTSSDPGQCLKGICSPVPQCYVSYGVVDCSSSYNQTKNGTTSGTSKLDTYACATGLTGPEYAYPLKVASDRMVTLQLTGTTVDFDLLVLEGSNCVGNAKCAASATTAGNGNETVTFMAKAGTDYVVVVEGRNGAKGSFTLNLLGCPPSCANSSNRLSCTSPSDTRSNADATRSKDVVDTWSCHSGTTGNEVVYGFYPPTAGMYTFELTGLTADLDLIVVEGGYSTCDPTVACLAKSVNAGTANESVTFMADPAKDYWIAVDGKNGAVSNYTIKLKSTSCPGASCYNYNKLDCTYLEDWRRNDDTSKSKNAVEAWACDANTSGPEVVYKLDPATAGSFTVTLDQLTADLDLIVLETTTAYSCDSNTACFKQSTNSGTTSESVTFTADPAKYYYIAVDGKNGAVGSYHIKMTSPTCSTTTCNNAYDSLSCTRLSTSSSNDASGATCNISAWGSCLSAMYGPERVHQFTPNGAGPYTVELIGLKADLDLAVIEATSTSTCSPAQACLASSKQLGTTSEKLTFTADPAKKYYFVVDGKAGISTYTLAVTNGCP